MIGVEYVNLASDYTDINDAVNHSIKVMRILDRFPIDEINDPSDVKVIKLVLKTIGCTDWNHLAPKFNCSGLKTLGDIIELDNNIEFPVSVYTQLMSDNSVRSVRYALSKAQDCWIKDWLDSQSLYLEQTEQLQQTNESQQDSDLTM